MRLLLIRHGETVDNVAGVYAGVRDSPLTAHGVLQASRLASHLTTHKISHIFSSDLQRAFKTAESIRLAQSKASAKTTKLQLLREQDFGFYEGKSYLERQKGTDKSGKDVHRADHSHEDGFQDIESKESMMARAVAFVGSFLTEHFQAEEETVVVVAHGIILSYLWRAVLKHFERSKIILGSGVVIGEGRGIEHLGGWANTGYLDLEIKRNAMTVQNLGGDSLEKPSPSNDPTRNPLEPDISNTVATPPQAPPAPKSTISDLSLVVKAVNSQEHLRGLKKTRGGIGSAKHDEKQQTMESFFKKRKIG